MENMSLDPEQQPVPEAAAQQSDVPAQESLSPAPETPIDLNPEAPADVAPLVAEDAAPVAEADAPVAEAPAPEAPAAPVQAEAPLADEESHLQALPAEQEEIEAEPEELFGQLSKEDLAIKMEAFSREQDVNAYKNRVQNARDAFQALFNPERDAALAAFLENGGVREEFEYRDPLEERFFNAYKSWQKRRAEYVQSQEKAKAENLKQKTAILHQMREILQKEEDMSKAFNEFHELQARWRAIGPVPPQQANDLWLTFKLYSDRFYEFIRLNRELQDLEMRKNLEMKLQLCERAEELLLEPSLNKALQGMQALQMKWREIGSVPREKRTEIWLRFKAAVDKVYENKRGYLEGQRKFFDDNHAAKSALIAKAEAIVQSAYTRHQDWQEGLKQLLELQAEWRKIGPAGKEHNESVWQKFKAVSDAFFRSKDTFYKQKKQEHQANFQAKTELCVQAESLSGSSDWKQTTNEFVRLQQEWKKIGPAGDKNERVWQRFKKACDAYFERKNVHFADKDASQGDNLTKKNELIAEVEQYQRPGDPGEALEQLKAFQRRFTEIGLVPMKQKDDIQQRFRNAIQAHFDALKSTPEYRQSLRQMREESGESMPPRREQRRDRPQHYSPQAAEAGGSEEQRNLQNKVSKLTGEVQLWENNLGFFANSKNAAALRQEYEQKINTAKDEIQKLRDRLKELRASS
ncbi:MAG: DUF349 domain-containing protein [Sphingobacteriales bacterium]|nr:DUF349 domain-containing protein [Sphingobacteriales bacterium]